MHFVQAYHEGFAPLSSHTCFTQSMYNHFQNGVALKPIVPIGDFLNQAVLQQKLNCSPYVAVSTPKCVHTKLIQIATEIELPKYCLAIYFIADWFNSTFLDTFIIIWEFVDSVEHLLTN